MNAYHWAILIGAGLMLAGFFQQRRFTRIILAKRDRLRAELQYFVDRCEGNHPDGHIRSQKCYMRFKKALIETRS